MAEEEMPQRRIRDVSAARSVVVDLRDRDTGASQNRAKVRSQAEGAPPRNPADLIRLGRGHESNTNFGSARSDLERACSGYFRLLWAGPRKIAVTLHASPETPNVDQIESAFEAAYDRFIRDWGRSAVIQHLSVIKDHSGFGIGTLSWDDKKCPRWKCVSRGNVRVRRGAKLDSSELPLVNLSQSFSISYLYEKIQDEKAATRAGWNVPLVKAWIAKLVANSSNDSRQRQSPTDWEKIQDDIRDNDAAASAICDNLECETLLVVERDLSVTKLIFTADQPPKRPGRAKSIEDGFLFEERDHAVKMDQALQMIAFEVPLGERNIHGVKGELIKGFPMHQWDDRMRNKITNAADHSLSLNVLRKQGTTTDYPVQRVGEVNVVDGAFEQLPYVQNLQPALSVLGVWEQNRAANLAQYRQGASQIADSNTARQATILASLEGETRLDSGTLFLIQFAEVKTEEIRRLRLRGSDDKDAKAFQRRLKEYGVDDQHIYETEITVDCASSPSGMAPHQRQQVNQEWIGLIGDPLVNKRFVLENKASEDWGPNGARKAIIQQNDPSQAAQARQANIESAQFGQGLTPDQIPALPQDDHAIHAARHMEPLGALVQRFQQTGQTDPKSATTAAFLSAHTRSHLDFLRGNKNAQPAYQALQGPFTAMEGRVDDMIRSAQATAEGPTA